MNKCVTEHVPTKQNPADLCAKVIPGGAQRDCLVTQTPCNITTVNEAPQTHIPRVPLLLSLQLNAACAFIVCFEVSSTASMAN
jgi:hypothetical protein